MNLSSGLLDLLLMDIGLKDAALLRGGATTDKRGLTIEVLSDLLKWGVLSLNVVEPNEDEFGTEPDTLKFSQLRQTSRTELAGQELT